MQRGRCQPLVFHKERAQAHWIRFFSCVFQCFSWKGKGAHGWFLTRRAHKHTGVNLLARNAMLWSKRCLSRGEFSSGRVWEDLAGAGRIWEDLGAPTLKGGLSKKKSSILEGLGRSGKSWEDVGAPTPKGGFFKRKFFRSCLSAQIQEIL